MVKRKKRLERGVESIKEQIALHLEKRNHALEEKQVELADYYLREIAAKEKDLMKKEDQLKRKKPGS